MLLMKAGYDHTHSDELETIDAILKDYSNVCKLFGQALPVPHIWLAYFLQNTCDGSKVNCIAWIKSTLNLITKKPFGLCDALLRK